MRLKRRLTRQQLSYPNQKKFYDFSRNNRKIQKIQNHIKTAVKLVRYMVVSFEAQTLTIYLVKLFLFFYLLQCGDRHQDTLGDGLFVASTLLVMALPSIANC